MTHHIWSDSPNLWSLPIEHLLSVVVTRIADGNPSYYASQNRTGTIKKLDDLLGTQWRVLLHAELGQSSQRLIAQHVNANAFLGVNWERGAQVIDVQVVSFISFTDAQDMLETVLDRVTPIRATPSANTIRVRFWMYGAMGPSSYNRVLPSLNSWRQAQVNYTASTAAALGEVMRWRKHPPEGGRLLLLHGPPGTGKTHAIRTLAREWGSWCNVHYVIDPDQFFSAASYMLQVLMDQQEGDNEAVPFDQEAPPLKKKQPPRWNLVVVEDADELLTVDAKKRTGQGMARLLNICDGLIGQGLNVMVLITTNEPVGNLHPAIIRPGRCLANITVDEMTATEANAWLASRNSEVRVTEPTPLAVLFEKVRAETTHVVTTEDTNAPGGYL